MDSAMGTLGLCDSEGYVIEVPGHQSTARTTNVNNGEDQGGLLVSRNVLISIQTTFAQVLRVRYFGYTHAIPLFDLYSKDMKSLSPAIESEIIVELQQLVRESGILPACYAVTDVTSSGIVQSRGGFADVYCGHYRGRVVCIKENRFSRDTQDKVRKDTLNEAILCGTLRHPNIVPFIGVYFKECMPSLVFLWMEHGDLVLYLKEYPLSNRVQLLCDVALGLRYLHERSIVHGDLKSVNILVDNFGRALIADFGLASILPSSGGTVMYQGPEIFDPEAYNTKESDIYAYGCLTYEVFTGKPPFANFAARLVASKVMYGYRPVRPSESSPSWNVWGLTEDIWVLIEKCWEATPARRPTIDVIIQRLELALLETSEK
ncbi:hypothetical protein H0H92_003978 [Tricholoma furcatifolium]|nr:hypothetical protein H0H92_003978 [Tricholoma furcatifolium]